MMFPMVLDMEEEAWWLLFLEDADDEERLDLFLPMI